MEDKPQGYLLNDINKTKYWCAIANTPFGRIPAKVNAANLEQCWYIADDGSQEEYMGLDFTIIYSQKTRRPNFVKEVEHCKGNRWAVALAQTRWGKIPGKARDGVCHYIHNKAVYQTKNFLIVEGV